MIDSEYEIQPVNNSCVNSEKITIVPQHGSPVATTTKNIDNVNNQHTVNSQYDNVDNMNVKPLYGGMKYKIIFRNKTFFISGKGEIEAIQKFLHQKIYKKDHLLEIYKNTNQKSVYIIRGHYKNKFKKVYSYIQ